MVSGDQRHTESGETDSPLSPALGTSKNHEMWASDRPPFSSRKLNHPIFSQSDQKGAEYCIYQAHQVFLLKFWPETKGSL
jgi:hypothetical protein